MASKDAEFGRVAVSLNHLTEEQVAEGLRLVQELRREGKPVTLARALVNNGTLSADDAKAIVQAMNRPKLARIGRYRLISRVGQGGMGTVYQAKQESLDKIVALKVLYPGLARRGDFVERFLREARSCGQLNHPNIVLGIAAGEADGYYYFAMEYIDGPSLKKILARDGKLPEPRALEITAAMAAALEHAFEHDIVHRDIKPGNILLTPDGTPKLADLGLAKEIHTDQSITQAAMPIGTPYYISPEQARGEQDVDQRADLYALGATLYHMVTGEVPFEGPTGAVVMARHLNDPIPNPRAKTPGLSSACVAIIKRAMEKDRDRRYQTATEVREDIEAALARRPLPHASKAPSQPHPRYAQRIARRRAQAAKKRKALLLAGGVLAAVVLVGVVVAVLASRKPAPPPPVVRRTTTSTVVPRVTPPPAKPITKPPPKPVPPKADPDAVLRELVDWAGGTADREAIGTRFSQFVIDHAGTPASQKAKAHLAALKARWKTLDDFKAALKDHVDNQRFKAALALLQAPPSDDVKKQVAALTAEVERAAARHIETKRAEGERYIENGRFELARALFKDLAALDLPAAVDVSRKAVERIAQLEAQRQAARARRAFTALLAESAPLIAAGRLDEARKLFAPDAPPDIPELVPLLEGAVADVDRLAKLFTDVEAELKALAAQGGSALIGRIRRRVTKVEDGAIHCNIGGPFPIHGLTPIDLKEMKSSKASPQLTPLLQLYRGQTREAKQALEGLAGDPPDPTIARWLRQIQWRQATGREGQAKKLFDQANTLITRKDWSNAATLLAQLRKDHADTAFVEARIADINKLAALCASGLASARRETETIRPFIDVTGDSGDLAGALQKYRPSGGWVMDIDNDGWLDIALDIRRAKGDDPHVPIFRNVTGKGSGKLVFRDVSKAMGLATGDEPICWVDLDGDGDLDVVCRGFWSGAGANRTRDPKLLALYENRCNEKDKPRPVFRHLPTKAALTASLGKVPGYTGFGFGNIAVLDADGDGRSDVLAQFVAGFERHRTLSLFLARQGQPFVFRDASLDAGFVKQAGKTFTLPPHLHVNAWPHYVVLDANGDDRTDFILNTDTGMVFLNRGGKTFRYVTDSTVKYQTNPSAKTNNNPRITPAVADYDNDGKIDIFVPQNGKNLLLRNKGGGQFEDAMDTTGPMATDAADSLWATWADVNNDGLLDLFVCNAGANNSLYVQTPNHAFADKAEHYGVAGKPSDATNFVAFGDLDRDGDIDMLMLRAQGRNQLLVNPYIKDTNHYSLNVLLRARLGSIGAKIHLHKAGGRIVGLQQVCRVEGYNRQTPREAFFGVDAPGQYVVRVVLSSRREIRRKVSVDPTQRNLLLITGKPSS